MKIELEIRKNWIGTQVVLSKIQGLTDKQLGWFVDDVVAGAKKNASQIPFEESTGELESKIYSTRLGVASYRIETTSGHASYIEWGTKFIEGKRPFLWPAYRRVKLKFMRRSRKWV